MLGLVLWRERAGFVKEVTGVALDDKRQGLPSRRWGYSVFMTRLAAAMVCSISSWDRAALVNPASNADGAR